MMWRLVAISFKRMLALTALATLAACASMGSIDARQEHEHYVLKTSASGSDAFSGPVHNNLSYALDNLQLTGNFGTDNFNDNLHDVWYHLQHPRTAIQNDGGTTRFINREIFPIDADRLNESAAMLPNYALHMLGGGMTFRKDLEWFRSRNYPYPLLTSLALAMTMELVQETLENDDVIDSDAIADFYIFRPLGLLLFSSDRVSRYIQQTLEPAIWPKMQSVDLKHGGFINTGITYVYRPPGLDFGRQRAFIYTGLNTLFGLSHELASGNTFSWGVGVAVEEITSQTDVEVTTRPSVGIFHDRDGSLLWSAVLNDAGDTRLSINIYPRGSVGLDRIGYFLAISDDHALSAGLSYRLPLGIGVAE